ncbi:hypothetical protein TNCV_2957521 [Trichonephila clavipes]|nr:hypothetical protein TNCV_2957521 [Trichonephila clavipes]
MSGSGGQSEARPQCFSPQASLVLILSTHRSRDVRLSRPCQPGNRTRTCGVEPRYAYLSTTELYEYVTHVLK